MVAGRAPLPASPQRGEEPSGGRPPLAPSASGGGLGWGQARRALILALLQAPLIAPAALVQEPATHPVSVRTIYGRTLTRDMAVTLYYNDARPAPRPVAVIGHGRPGSAEERDRLKPRYEAIATWLANLGFIVAVPVRIGYGETGGEDLEHGGACHQRDYVPGFNAAADQLQAVLEMVRARPDAARDRAVLIGQSFGGASVIALAARNLPGVQLAINFAGGAGGDPVKSPQRPCSPAQLKHAFAKFGGTARTPTLWLYTENDRYFGPENGRAWFDAFRAAGGSGDFVLLPAWGDDGHRVFSAAPRVWQPQVLEVLRAHGLVTADAGGAARRLVVPGSGNASPPARDRR